MFDLVRRWSLSRVTLRMPGQCTLCRLWCRGPICAECEALHPVDDASRCALCALMLPRGINAGLGEDTGTGLRDAPGDRVADPDVDSRRRLRCGRCASHPPPLSRCIAAMDYVFPWDRLLLGLKFGERLELAPLMASRLARAIARADIGAAPDLIVPIPLSMARLRERGYNQAHEIARRLPLVTERQSRLCARTLVRVRHTDQQAQLPLDERRHNLRGAFAVVAPVRGLRVAIVDDVMTSGATLLEAALTLRRAGAADVQAWVAARTP